MSSAISLKTSAVSEDEDVLKVCLLCILGVILIQCFGILGCITSIAFCCYLVDTYALLVFMS